MTAAARALVVVVCVLSPAAGRAADPPLARTLEEVVRGALASDESLRIVEDDARIAALRSRRYLLSLTPDVQVQASYTRAGAEDADSSGSSSGDTYAWALGLTQPLYTGGRASAAYRGQKNQEASARLQVERARRELTLAAAEAFYGALLAAEAVSIGEQAVALARRQLERAARRVELGEVVLNDQLRAEVSLRGLEAELAGSRSTLAKARESVRRLSSLTLAADLVVPRPLPPIAGSDESLVAEALASRQEPEQARLAVAAAEEDVREKQGRFLPSLALSASWGESGDTLSEREWAWSAGVALEVPIYQSGATAYTLRESRVALEQERLRAAGAARDIESEVRGLLRDIEAARSGIESLRLGVAAAAENLRLTGRRYEVGLAYSLEVADAQNAEVAARVDLAAAGYRLEVLTLRLRSALGRELFAGAGAEAKPRADAPGLKNQPRGATSP